MTLTKPTLATNVLSILGTTSAERLLTEDEFKAKFDETPAAIKTYLNDVLTAEVDLALADATTLVQSVAVPASKTLALTDRNTLQACNHATVAIVNTIPPNSSVAFPIGTQIAFSMDGVADVSVALGAGVTITNTAKLKIANQGESMALLKTGTDTWKLFGSLKA